MTSPPESPRPRESLILSTPGEIRSYPDTGYAEKIFQRHGLRLDVARLLTEVLLNPLASEIGAVCVQTMHSKKTRKPNRYLYYMDTAAMVDPQRNQGILLDDVPLGNHRYDITIGAPWYSPMGPTEGVVETVAIPWSRSYQRCTNVAYSQVPPTIIGRQLTDQMLLS